MKTFGITYIRNNKAKSIEQFILDYKYSPTSFCVLKANIDLF